VAKRKATGIKPRRYRIHVRTEVISCSVRGDSQHCMIRNAVAEAIPGATRIMVDLQWVRFSLNGYRYRYPLPVFAAYKLASFESGDVPESFSFSLVSGQVFVTTGIRVTKPGTARAMRAFGVARGLMTQEQAEAKGRIPKAVKEGYLAENPGVPAVATQSGRTPMVTRRARQNIETDRFYGLRLASGFQPGGQPA